LHMSNKAIPSYEFMLPPPGLVARFTGLVSPLRAQIAANQSQTELLENVRDTLLPKLLSGEVRVKDAEQFADVAL
jgi:type I restriction enzyme, S subunit